MSDLIHAIQAMLVCALWSSIDFDGEPLDAAYGIEDFAEATRLELEADLTAFMDAEAANLAASGLNSEQIGHDFWLTTNGHGAGFWDRGLGEIGDRLTRAAKVYGGTDLYVGDDGKIYA